MITVFDAKNYAQQWLFEKAFASLKAKNKLTEAEINQGRFLSLDGYFAHMSDLIEINPNYVMIPADEKPFEINANNRTITVPADFSKCAGVAGDAMCEIITFTIDRYFDYVDLANTLICIQWVTPDKREGISHISLIDTETTSGKIRFGWPLTEEITSVAGSVSFAVRFYANNKSDSEQESKAVYLFNTLTASIPIKQGLQLVNPTEEANSADLFSKFIKNSNNPSYPIPSPVFFGYPGKNLDTQASIGADNTLTLEGQAIVDDNGHIEYQWYLIESDKDVATKLDDSDERFEIREIYNLLDPRPEERVGSKQYYTKAEDAEAYSLVVSEDLPDVDLYERSTTLKIVDSARKDVTGQYYFGAINRIGANSLEVDGSGVEIDAVNSTNESYSNKCLVPFPDDVTIEDLPENQFIEDKNSLEAKVNKDNGNPAREYVWYRDGEIVTGEDEAKYNDLVIPGHYSVKVKSVLNRTEKEAESNICRIVKYPVVPEVNYLYKNESMTDFEAYEEDLDLSMGDTVSLKVLIADDFINDDLQSDNILYQWYVRTSDSTEAKALKPIDAGVDKILVENSDPNTNEIKVRQFSNASDSVYSFYCEIKNELAGKIAVLENPKHFVIK